LADFVGHSKTAAKLVASIKSRDDLERTSQEKLLEKCVRIGVTVREENGQLMPEENDIVRFLEILDRRGYDFDITDDQPEIYVASSRKRIR
jgi:glutaredoxin 2